MLAALGVLALGSSGCLVVGAGVAGGAVAGYYYFKGSVCQNYDAAFAETWAAVRTALDELGLPIVSEEHDPAGGSFETRTSDGDRVRIFVTILGNPAAERSLTRVSVRVGTFGDQPLSDRILTQVDRHLAPAPRAVAVVPQTPPPPTSVLNQTSAPPLAEPQSPARLAPSPSAPLPPQTAPPPQRPPS
jgi:hypothetical protein